MQFNCTNYEFSMSFCKGKTNCKTVHGFAWIYSWYLIPFCIKLWTPLVYTPLLHGYDSFSSLIDSEEPKAKTRKPPKPRFLSCISIILVFLLIAVTVAFIEIVVFVEKTRGRATDTPCVSGNGTCTSPGCVARAAGMLPKLFHFFKMWTI